MNNLPLPRVPINDDAYAPRFHILLSTLREALFDNLFFQQELEEMIDDLKVDTPGTFDHMRLKYLQNKNIYLACGSFQRGLQQYREICFKELFLDGRHTTNIHEDCERRELDLSQRCERLQETFQKYQDQVREARNTTRERRKRAKIAEEEAEFRKMKREISFLENQLERQIHDNEKTRAECENVKKEEELLRRELRTFKRQDGKRLQETTVIPESLDLNPDKDWQMKNSSRAKPDVVRGRGRTRGRPSGRQRGRDRGNTNFQSRESLDIDERKDSERFLPVCDQSDNINAKEEAEEPAVEQPPLISSKKRKLEAIDYAEVIDHTPSAELSTTSPASTSANSDVSTLCLSQQRFAIVTNGEIVGYTDQEGDIMSPDSTVKRM